MDFSFDYKQTNNFMLDDVKSLLSQGLNQEELINLLTAQKIEYGRLCINQFLTMTYNTTNEQREDYHYKLDVELTKRIKEIGLKPIEIYTIEKQKK